MVKEFRNWWVKDKYFFNENLLGKNEIYWDYIDVRKEMLTMYRFSFIKDNEFFQKCEQRVVKLSEKTSCQNICLTTPKNSNSFQFQILVEIETYP